MKKLLSIIIILFFIISSIPIVISDIPINNVENQVWPMKCHDTKHTGRSPVNTADNPLIEKWKFNAWTSVAADKSRLPR